MSTARAIQSFAGKAMTVAGIMSGTSGDGIDVALVRIAPGADRLRLKLLAHHALPFAKSLRQAVLAAMDAKAISTAELARLNWRLGMARKPGSRSSRTSARRTWSPAARERRWCHSWISCSSVT